MVNGINCQNYQLLIGRKEMVVLRQAQSDSVVQSDSRAQRDIVAQSDTRPVILSSSFPVILSSSKDDLKSKDDSRRRLRVGDPVPLRQAQSDSVVQSNSGAQRDIFTVILSSSKDDHRRRLRVGGTVPLRQAQSDSVVQSNSVAQSDIPPVILSSSKDDLKSKDDPKSKDKKGVLCRKNIAIVV
jgi:hypothetical protein